MAEHEYESELAEFRRRWYRAHVERFDATEGDAAAASSVPTAKLSMVGAEGRERQARFRRSAPGALACLDGLARSGDLGDFVQSMAVWARSPDALSFNGFSGQMFLNQIGKAADDPEATARVLAETLRPPRDRAEAHRKLTDLTAEVRRIGSGSYPSPGYSAFLASYFWAMQDRASWPVAWPSALGFIQYCTSEKLPSTSDPAGRYQRYLQVLSEFDDDFERFERVAAWWDYIWPTFLDSVLIDRCRFGLDGDTDPAALRANAAALVEVSAHLGGALCKSVSEASGLELRVERPQRDWKPGRGRSDLWVDWRLPIEPGGGIAVRLWVNHNGAAIGLHTGHLSQWTDLKSSLEALLPPEFEQFKVARLSDLKSSDDEHGPAGPDGDVIHAPLDDGPRPGLHGFVGSSGDLFYGRWYEPETLNGLDLQSEVVSVTEALRPTLEQVMRVAEAEGRAVHAKKTDDETSGHDEEPSDEAAAGDSSDEIVLSLDARIEDLAEELLLEDRGFLDDIVELLDDKGQVVFYGPPGTGKTHLARKLAEALAPDPSRRMLVQFHPSTSYEDFFEGYRPETGPDGAMSYRLTPGPLARLAERAAADPGRRHVMVIDEINRANLPRVLGELLFLLEYRDESALTLYRPDEPFELPSNLRFIGTMNTADRSIALIDAALRRRFQFVPFFPDRGPASGLLERWLRANGEPEWVGVLVDTVNDDLAHELGGSHLLLGASHFMKKGLNRDRLRQIWEYNVEPFIEDQFFGDPARIDRFRFDAVLGRYLERTGDPSVDPAEPAADGLDNTEPEPPTA